MASFNIVRIKNTRTVSTALRNLVTPKGLKMQHAVARDSYPMMTPIVFHTPQRGFKYIILFLSLGPD